MHGDDPAGRDSVMASVSQVCLYQVYVICEEAVVMGRVLIIHPTLHQDAGLHRETHQHPTMEVRRQVEVDVYRLHGKAMPLSSFLSNASGH
jgi:hypothetical protein